MSYSTSFKIIFLCPICWILLVTLLTTNGSHGFPIPENSEEILNENTLTKLTAQLANGVLNANATLREALSISPEDIQNALNSTSSNLPGEALGQSVVNLFTALRSSLRRVLMTGQAGLLRAIGTFDKTVSQVGEGIQNSTFAVLVEGQKAAAKIYEMTPPQVNQFIRRIGETDNRQFTQQLNQVLLQYRENRRRLFDLWEAHEYHFHNVFQDAWSRANRYLGVQELPRMRFGWF